MAKELAYVNVSDLVDTADVLRERLGTTESYGTWEFAEAIRSIQCGTIQPEYDTPTITISNSGLITASANGKSATQQLTIQAATAITPTESQQTAVSSGKYTTGNITVNAIPSNYVGTSITRQEAKTITPSEQPQSAVNSGVYTTGNITVAAIPNDYVGSSVVFQKYYTGSTNPASSLGNNGDLYLMVTLSSDDIEEEDPFSPVMDDNIENDFGEA